MTLPQRRTAFAFFSLALAVCLAPAAATGQPPPSPAKPFPDELVHFVPYQANPVFAGTGTNTWDRRIRERGYILRENDQWHLWYTGYNDDRSDARFLGYATSPDGLHWTRFAGNPVHGTSWVEDVCVVKRDGTYTLFAEGRNDLAHLLTSTDRIHWTERGQLDIRLVSGQPLPAGPFGTPTVWVEGQTWYLFYERSDAGVWLAKSRDCRVWTNVQDTPVLAEGPDAYDRQAIALDQVIRYQGRYYGIYHACAHRPWRDWTTCIAASDDLVHWQKYPGNPIVAGDCSSGQLVQDGRRYRLYTMHPDVRVFFAK